MVVAGFGGEAGNPRADLSRREARSVLRLSLNIPRYRYTATFSRVIGKLVSAQEDTGEVDQGVGRLDWVSHQTSCNDREETTV